MSESIPYPPVLIVDDDENLRQTMSRVLRRVGCLVTAAPGGREGLEVLRGGFRGLILLDVMMPEMDGWMTIRTMVDEGLLSGSLICMLTAVVEPDAKAEGLGQYVFDYLVKPFDLARLMEILRLAALHLMPEP